MMDCFPRSPRLRGGNVSSTRAPPCTLPNSWHAIDCHPQETARKAGPLARVRRISSVISGLSGFIPNFARGPLHLASPIFWHGGSPFLSLTVSSAESCNRVRTAFEWPNSTAPKRGVRPSGPNAFEGSCPMLTRNLKDDTAMDGHSGFSLLNNNHHPSTENMHRRAPVGRLVGQQYSRCIFLVFQFHQYTLCGLVSHAPSGKVTA